MARIEEKYKWILRERKVNILRACVRNVRNNEHSSIIKSIIDRFLYSVSSEEVAFISIIRVTICRHNRIMKYSYKYIYTMHKKLFFFNPELLIFKVYFFYLLLIFKLIFSTYLYSLISFWKIIRCVFPRIFENVRINESNIDTERKSNLFVDRTEKTSNHRYVIRPMLFIHHGSHRFFSPRPLFFSFVSFLSY